MRKRQIWHLLLFEESNLVEVRVVSQLFGSAAGVEVNSYAIENCNRIYRMKKKEFEAVRVWKVSKKMGFTCSGQEDTIISRLQSLKVRDSCKLRNDRGDQCMG